METNDNKFYYKPLPDNRTYENALIKATFLVDNGYVNTTDGYTLYNLVDELIDNSKNTESV